MLTRYIMDSYWDIEMSVTETVGGDTYDLILNLPNALTSDEIVETAVEYILSNWRGPELSVISVVHHNLMMYEEPINHWIPAFGNLSATGQMQVPYIECMENLIPPHHRIANEQIYDNQRSAWIAAFKAGGQDLVIPAALKPYFEREGV